MCKKREHKTEAELREQVAKEIPYVVGQGQKCVQARTKRLKELFRKHGYDTSTAPDTFGNSFSTPAHAGGARMSHRTNNIESREEMIPPSSNQPHFAGTRLA